MSRDTRTPAEFWLTQLFKLIISAGLTPVVFYVTPAVFGLSITWVLAAVIALVIVFGGVLIISNIGDGD